MFSEHLEQWLENFLDMGLTEWQFWDMTLAELDRYAESFKRVQKRKAQEEAFANYRLADLIGYSMARLYSREAKYPEIYDVYPAIFEKDAILEARDRIRNQRAETWLRNFAESFNKSKTEEGKDNT